MNLECVEQKKTKNCHRKKIFSNWNQWIDNIKNFICAHPILVLSILMLGTSIFVFCQFLFKRQIFMYSDIGSDTRNVYYPFFVSFARKLEQGDFSLWDFSYGMGTNVLIRQTDVGNVFTYLYYILGGKGIKYALIFVHILKIFISGYLCYFYLGRFQYTIMSKVIVAYIYAFNGFMMLWGQHYFFGNASICIILMLWSIEVAFHSAKGYIFTALSTFSIMCTSYYLAYMVLLFAALYVVFRLIYIYSVKQAKTVIRNGSGLLCSVLVGACLSAFLFIPSVVLIATTSARLSDGASLFDKIFATLCSNYDAGTIHSIVSRMLSNNLMGTYDFSGPLNYYELPQWFFTSFILFFSFIFVFELILDKNESTKRRILKGCAVVLILFTTFHPIISLVLNGFVAQFFRYTYLFMPILGLLLATVLDKVFLNRLKYGKMEIFVAGSLSLFIMSKNIYGTNTASRVSELLGYAYILMLAIFVMICLFVQDEKRNSVKRILCIVCSGLIIIANVSIESYVTNNIRTTTSVVNEKIYQTSGNDVVQEILSELNKNDKSFYRVEKTFQDISYLNDSMVQGYYGISAYNAGINKNIIEFKNQICPEFKVTEAEGYYDFQKIQKDVDVVSLLGVKYILSLNYIEDVESYRYLKTVEGVHVYQNTATEGIARFFANAMDYEEFNELSQQEKHELISDYVVIHDLEETVEENEEKEQSTVIFETPTNSSYVKGTVDAKSTGWVFVAIPYEDGWTAYVDGQETPILQADIAFSAIEISEGEHEIVFQYKTPYLKEGIVISFVGGVILFGWCAVIYIQTKKRKDSVMERVR